MTIENLIAKLNVKALTTDAKTKINKK